MSTGNTGWKSPTGGTGSWSNPNNVVSADGSYATAGYSVVNEGGGVFSYNNTPDLNAYGFGTSSTDARVIGVEVEIGALRSGAPSGASLVAQIYIDGAPYGSPKSFSLGTSLVSTVLGSAGDAWGIPAIQASYIDHLWVHIYAVPNGTSAGVGTASVDWVSMRLTYEQPDAFGFTNATNQPLNTTVQSDVKTITGITNAANVSVAGGEWRKNNGAYTFGSGTVVAGDQVQVRNTTSSSYGGNVSTTLTVGGVAGVFTSTTQSFDTTPDGFVNFNTQTGQNPSSSVLSNSQVIQGITGPSPWSITGGTLYLNNVAQGGTSGTLNNFDTVAILGTANATLNGSSTATLTVGGVPATFTIVTRGADTTPDAYSWTDESGVGTSTLRTSNIITIHGIEAATTVVFSGLSGGTIVSPATHTYEYRINSGTWFDASGSTPVVNNNDTVQLRMGSNAATGVAANMTTTIGGVADSWTETTTTGDQTPNPFTFTDEPGAGQSTLVTAVPVVIDGIDIAATIVFSAMANGTVVAPATHAYEYSIAGGAWQDCAGTAPTITNGQTLTLRLGSNATIGNTATITATISGVSGTWHVTSAAPDQAPNPFAFTDVAGADVSTLTVSDIVTITGINAPSPISVLGGEYSVNGGAWTTATGTVVNRDQVQVRINSAASLSTTVNSALTIGGVTDTFSVTTRSPDLASQYVIMFRETVYGIDV